MSEFPYVYFWHRCGRKGQICKVTARGKMNSCRVVFKDGFSMITSRNALRKDDHQRDINKRMSKLIAARGTP